MTILAVLESNGQAVVRAKSGLTGEVSERTYPMDKRTMVARLEDWAAGKNVQNVFPDLSADDREFLMTGITPAEWDAAFGDG